jgi:hypothetical protein
MNVRDAPDVFEASIDTDSKETSSTLSTVADTPEGSEAPSSPLTQAGSDSSCSLNHVSENNGYPVPGLT